jgi:hypothetical protein
MGVVGEGVELELWYTTYHVDAGFGSCALRYHTSIVE